ncbi:uridylate kinase [Candidatus Bathyarchaeota archaeon ex4484_231]|nr:MAG: uridylate kinase [Candidatus Bathyarchaeota archaeon ex4484_231]RJS76219.1 MAG: UMP kinase [Candidatus Bathyarchaeota archaeon]
MRVVIRIGGSVIASPPKPELIKRYAEIIRNLRAQGHELVIIVGGGAIARQFIQLAKQMSLKEPEQDEIAISVSRLFAQMMALKLGGLDWKTIPTSIDAVSKALKERGTVVMGGLKPGMTTDTVAALVASEINAQFIVKATDQDGVYTKDPRTYPDAVKLDALSFDELDSFLEEDKHKAGIHQILDPEAVRVLKKERIQTIIVNGLKPENIIAAINGKKVGTLIK